MARMTKVVRIRAIGLLWPCISLVVMTQLCAVPALAAPPPLGEPNEVWVTTSSGDTIVVGEEVELQVHVANANPVDLVVLTMTVGSTDLATWEWLIPDSASSYATITSGSRYSEHWGFLGASFLPSPPLGGPAADTLELGMYSPYNDPTPAGPLENFCSLHLRPLSPGTITIDSVCASGCIDSYWNFWPSGVWPAWAGPLQFTVIEPVAGDINCDGQANIEDAVYLINWIFRGGPPPCR